jgi:methyl-accepting chemotaxis protein
MRRRATAISATDLDQRLPPAGNNDELGRLGRTLNEMLARIQESVIDAHPEEQECGFGSR